MIAIITQEGLELAPAAVLTPHVLDNSQEIVVTRNFRQARIRVWKVGGVVDHPEAYMLVQMGVAVPGDEKCAVAAGMSEEQIAAAQHAAERLRAGIHPSDFSAYDAGLMSGYNGDGTHKPGLNGAKINAN
ncbi:MAG: hypothetical protein EBR82_23570 [Caulobacteraceae bacterium]|nr:hypothetical protein [Caulobacteraceae bacterium]